MKGGVKLVISIKPGSTPYNGRAASYSVNVQALGAKTTGAVNPVPVMIAIGNDAGSASVMAAIK